MHTLDDLEAGRLTGARHLKLPAGLTQFPSAILGLADTLETLDLSDNALSSLPDDFARLTKLRILFCSNNRFTVLPPVLGSLPELAIVGFKANRIARVPAEALPPSLRWLILTDNAVGELPASIGACGALQKLMLAGNRLRALPAALAGNTRLELLRMSANRFDRLPAFLLAMPRLAWLACGGNPFCAVEERRLAELAPVEDIAWPELVLHERLGEGASGVIYRASRAGGDGGTPDDDAARGIEADCVGHAEVAGKDVGKAGAGHTGEPVERQRAIALKIFKGAVTSDGWPASEMAACLGAGEHPNLIGIVGRLALHPEDADGLAMTLVDPEFANLAGPPSLDSCTRDVYAAQTTFDIASVLALAGGVASACAQLHRRGIVHGDLYGHNILHASGGRALLGDFGAASCFDPGAGAAQALQRLETRAFGLLLGELIERCASLSHQPPASATGERDMRCAGVARPLMQLQARCIQEDVLARPAMAEVALTLETLSAIYAAARA